jgi:hypothetical protein
MKSVTKQNHQSCHRYFVILLGIWNIDCSLCRRINKNIVFLILSQVTTPASSPLLIPTVFIYYFFLLYMLPFFKPRILFIIIIILLTKYALSIFFCFFCSYSMWDCGFMDSYNKKGIYTLPLIVNCLLDL